MLLAVRCISTKSCIFLRAYNITYDLVSANLIMRYPVQNRNWRRVPARSTVRGDTNVGAADLELNGRKLSACGVVRMYSSDEIRSAQLQSGMLQG